MSDACGLWFLRAIAAKNCASEGYTQFPSAGLGIEDVSRSVDRWEALAGDFGWSDGKRRLKVEGESWSTGHLSATGHFSEAIRGRW
jgi:hypothetical protein